MVIRNEKSRLETVDEVVDAAGGTRAVSRLTGDLECTVSNWRRRTRLPPKTFLLLTERLHALGLSAPSTLWGIKPASKQDPATE